MTTEMSTKNVVLYADDDQDDLDLVREAFSRFSHNVELVTVTDGFQVLSFLKNLSALDQTPCLIILDINMPRLNGKETLMQLREMDRYKDVPTILFTTSTQPKDQAFAQQYKAGFLTKPIDVTQLDFIADQFINHCIEEIKRDIGRPTSNNDY